MLAGNKKQVAKWLPLLSLIHYHSAGTNKVIVIVTFLRHTAKTLRNFFLNRINWIQFGLKRSKPLHSLRTVWFVF